MNQSAPIATASRRVSRWLALLSLTGLLTGHTAFLATASAQNAPAATPTETEPVLQLDTFKVTTAIDTYKEDRNLSSSKMPIDMKDLAATLQVLNTSFINDKVATALEDLYPY